jgi:hypothetical protein
MSTIVPHKDSTVLDEINVESTTIDRYCEENDIHLNGIKIDVEGAEKFVIEGCQSIIGKYSPWILMEFHGHLMSSEERLTCWYRIVDQAKEVIFIDGFSNLYQYGSKVESIPDCLNFHVLIKN